MLKVAFIFFITILQIRRILPQSIGYINKRLMSKNSLRIVFMGTPEFLVPSLKLLLQNGYHIVAVVTAPDSYGGRGGKELIQSRR